MDGKLAVVTGSDGGIGGAVATAFAGAGAEVVGLDHEQADLTPPEEVAIVNLFSAMALTAGDDDFATHASQVSKGGILTLTRAMAFHYGRDGIRVNAPGLIATPMRLRAQSDPAIVARLPELHPLTGDFGRPEDVAGAALYLATADFVTGAILNVDAGWTL